MARITHWPAMAATALTLALLGNPAVADGYYRWVDDQGQTHFSQRPPEGRASEYVSRTTGRTISSPPPRDAAPVEAPPAPVADAPPAESEAADIDSIQGLPERDSEQCRQAREALEILDGHPRIRARGSDGEVRVLSQEEREAQRQQVQEVIDLHC